MQRFCATGNLVAAALITCLTVMPAAAEFGGELFKLAPADPGGLREFGVDVAVNGNTAIVGATGNYFQHQPNLPGAAFLFDMTTGQEIRKLTASQIDGSDLFGSAVALADNIAIVGSPADIGFGAAFLFDVATGQQMHKVTAPNPVRRDEFGASVAISGNLAVVGAPTAAETGFAVVFDVTTGEMLKELNPSDSPQWARFGADVAVDGNLAIVGAPNDPHLGYGSGSVYVFDLTTGNELMKLIPSDAREGQLFGVSVAINGDRALIGASGEGCCEPGGAYLFDLTTGTQLMKLASNAAPYVEPQLPGNKHYDRFGRSVALYDRFALVGAPGDNEHARESGAMYLYDASTGDLLHKFKAAAASEFEWFGGSVAMSDKVILEGNDPEKTFGRAYVFSLAPEPPFIATLATGTMFLMGALRRR